MTEQAQSLPTARAGRAALAVLLALALALAAHRPAAAAEARRDDIVFGVYILGLKVGELRFQGTEARGRYETGGVLRTTGLMQLVARVHYEAYARGRARGGRLVPEFYRERAYTGTRYSEATMAYRRGVPQVKLYKASKDAPARPRKPGPRDVDPRTQAGTLDPMTTIYVAMRDAPERELCRLKVHTFDGARRALVRIYAPEKHGDEILCQGEYRRIAGFSEAEMRDKTSFPFILRYRPRGDGWYRLERITTDTTFGKAHLIRLR